MKHFYQTIGGYFNFQAMYAWAVWSAPDHSHFVEVGSYLGMSAAFMGVEILNSEKSIQFDCVDHWRGSVEHQNEASVVAGTLYEDFLRNTDPVRTVVRPVRGESMLIAGRYTDLSLQFVYIDASHDYSSVLTDLASWWPKIRLGGWMAGHDFTSEGVGRAVMYFMKNKPVEWMRIQDGTWCVCHQRDL